MWLLGQKKIKKNKKHIKQVMVNKGRQKSGFPARENATPKV
jgi:hypothetical protein